MTKITETAFQEWIRRHRRNIGIPFVLASLFLARFQQQYFLISLVLTISGELIRIWAAGHLRKEEILTTGGPYRWMRNPLYLGSFLIAVGFATVAGSFWIWILMLAYFLFCYFPVIRYEEKILEEKFTDKFSSYKSRVPAFYPTLIPYPSRSTTFSWSQVWKNKEYNAILGIVLVYCFLLFLPQR